MRNKKTVLSLYGNVALVRGYCEDCETMSFIQKGHFSCCGNKTDKEPEKLQRIIEPEFKRKIPTKDERKAILEEQDYKCLYCELSLGSVVYRNKKSIVLKVHWDHILPFNYQQNNKTSNFAAACHICNHLKYSFIFRDLDDARIALKLRWEEKGYSTH